MIGSRIRMDHVLAPATDVNEGRIVGEKEGVGYLVAVKGNSGFEIGPHEKLFVKVPLDPDETGWWVREGEFEILLDEVTT